jgi:hypothetical protein
MSEQIAVMSVPQIAQRIADWAKAGGGRNLEAGEVQAILEPWLTQAKSGLDQAVRTMQALSKGEGDWRFSLGDGLIAVVNFSGPVKRQHLAAFVKVFSVMAEAYVEADAEENGQ